ncbi:MAG: glycosyltransferase [Candidatus Omnitrophota bacterium]|nr:MAG: glycosyltransferase [Candidatus Omnitrophota bacterium]
MISVVIPCFNAEKWIGEALESVVVQGVDDIEIIVIDDGSTDKSVELIERNFSFVRLIKTSNQGPSKTRNRGTQESKGQFIQYLDADDLLAPNKLKAQFEALNDSGADVAYGDWQKLIEDSGGKYVKGQTMKRKLKNPEIDLFANCWCPPAVYLFRRSMVERVGEWNERLPIIQDARFALDCAFHGGRFVYCPGIMAYYRTHSVDSVSSRDSIGFVRDCFKNACEIEERWRNCGGINRERKGALVKVYGYIARASFKNDPDTFEITYQALERLSPGYRPEKPRHLRLASKLLGYRKAETLAYWYRKMKRVFR